MNKITLKLSCKSKLVSQRTLCLDSVLHREPAGFLASLAGPKLEVGTYLVITGRILALHPLQLGPSPAVSQRDATQDRRAPSCQISMVRDPCTHLLGES